MHIIIIVKSIIIKNNLQIIIIYKLNPILNQHNKKKILTIITINPMLVKIIHKTWVKLKLNPI